MVGGIGAGPAGHLPPKSWGSNASPLIRHLRKGHQNVKLDAESMNRLITWTDLNGPYYPTSHSAYAYHMTGRCPLNKDEIQTLAELTDFSPEEEGTASRYKGPSISFDRPQLSPCLESLAKNSPKYRKALALIRKGQERLRKRPRADMPGFVPWERDLERMAHVKKYRAVEANSRKAIREEAARGEM